VFNIERNNITIISTGGTIEKVYDEKEGKLENQQSVLEEMFSKLRLPELKFNHISLLSKDSLNFTDDDREEIVNKIIEESNCTPVLVLHGTDTLAETAALLCRRLRDPEHPVIMTGAMRPFGYENSDAIQNLTEALFALRHLEEGMFLAFHGRLLTLPDIKKDKDSGHFVVV
jgi:L-asparaginase